MFNSKKYRFISHYASDIISFSFKILIPAILVVGVYILVGISIQGYFFVSRYFMVAIQLAIRISTALITIKIIYTIVQIFFQHVSGITAVA